MISGNINLLHFGNIVKYLKYMWNLYRYAAVFRSYFAFILNYTLSSYFIFIKYS